MQSTPVVIDFFKMLGDAFDPNKLNSTQEKLSVIEEEEEFDEDEVEYDKWYNELEERGSARRKYNE